MADCQFAQKYKSAPANAPKVRDEWPDDRFDMVRIFSAGAVWSFSEKPKLFLGRESERPITRGDGFGSRRVFLIAFLKEQQPEEAAMDDFANAKQSNSLSVKLWRGERMCLVGMDVNGPEPDFVDFRSR